MEFPNSGGGKLVSGLKWAATAALAAAFLVQLKQCLDKYSSRQASFLLKNTLYFFKVKRGNSGTLMQSWFSKNVP